MLLKNNIMCGFYFSNFFVSEFDVRKRLSRAQFRGPDFSDVKIEGCYSFGHNRLSIIDLDSRSNQPFSYMNYIVVYNGEIYNYREIRSSLILEGYEFSTDSDTEVLCASYDKWGVNCLNEFIGMFSFVIFNKLNNEIFCARDRLGVKPFYYALDNGRLEVASQLSMIEHKEEIDNDALHLYLKYGYIPTPKSIYSNVKKLEAGSYFILNNKECDIKPLAYWSLHSGRHEVSCASETLRRWQILIEEAVRIRLNADVNLGTFLSSGVDSTLVSKYASLFSKDISSTFTVGFDEFEFNESNLAREISHKIGIKNICVNFNPNDLLSELGPFFVAFDEPFSDIAALPSLALSREFKKNMTVALSGDGGDELFLGYKNYKYLPLLEFIIRIPFFIRRVFRTVLSLLIFILPSRRLLYLHGVLSQRNLNELALSFFADFSQTSRIQKCHALNSGIFDLLNLHSGLLEKIAVLNVRLWLESNSNVKTDRSSMFYGVELRSPFLDHRLYDFWKTIKLKSLYDSGRKNILRGLLNLFELGEYVSRKKRGFSVPINDWIKGSMRSEIDSLSNCKAIFEEVGVSYYRFKYIVLLNNWGLINRGNWIWRIFVLIKWHENQIKK